jgi:predicted PurR-regulated permease PerM
MPDLQRPSQAGPPADDDDGIGRQIFRAAMRVLLVIVTLLVLRFQSDVFFVILAGYLFSIALRYPSQWIIRRVALPYTASLLIVATFMVASVAFGFWFIGARLTEQLQALSEQLPKSMASTRAWMGRFPWASSLLDSLAAPEREVSPRNIVTGAQSVFSATFHAGVAVVVVFFIGAYGAAQPGAYSHGLLGLVSIRARRSEW